MGVMSTSAVLCLLEFAVGRMPAGPSRVVRAAERTVSPCLAGCVVFSSVCVGGGGWMEGPLLLWDDPPEATAQSSGCLWPSVGFESCLPSLPTSLKRKGRLKQKQKSI